MRTKLGALPYVILLFPFDVLVIFGVLFTHLCALVSLWFRTQKHRDTKAQRCSVSPATILIVNWDGKHLLAECLPSVLEAVRCDGGKHEILVIDNGSTDGSVNFVRSCFPDVRVLALDRNYGFAGGNNRGVAEVQTDIVVLLNNDMTVDRGFLQPLLNGFSDTSVFSVTSQIFLSGSDRREETGKTRAEFNRGFLELRHEEIRPGEELAETIPVFWAGGGSCAFDRRKYLEIGGFDSLYHPFYVEDTDLSYQAWKRGWKCLLAPASHVIHKHRGTSRPKFGNEFVDNTIRKNLYLFIWKNVTDSSMIFDHLANLPGIHGRGMFQREPRFEIRAFLRALRQLPEALGKRIANVSHYVISDHEVLARIQKP
ncbi:MAG TPA: glycosyltransferase family 2 protein [Terriglobia bacterium]|nr:glycosyltransferase family 2 protein [Terriglobia bacterium]